MVDLLTVKNGHSGTIAALKTQDEATIRKLMALGVMPGITLTLEQKFPSYIIKVGRTRAALDRETAASIYLHIAAS
ncbi:FeoA family protein [Aerosakkonema funiforme]|uniref:Ferrous iron transport protein A n=1 Tax=Aerosakkonema funiforme FACHB-1375 TaxID=2949571 RepID=A0A926VJK4_9CYAN|nr:FeoA family protein [Aerosakkonema funiforme]MBD2184398.1 ferrous iron transport protein A [Aerosakkonema funiforme FACHB-1375]